MPSTPEGRAIVEKFVKEGWIFVGGQRDPRVWRDCKKSYNLTDEDLPPHSCWCECNEEIMYNSWIFNKKTREIKVVGNVCVKKFTGGKRIVCDECGESHRNRKINKCNVCRRKYCYDCNVELKQHTYYRCYDCNIKRPLHLRHY